MSLAFLFKKTWHPSTLQNSERVWIAEQKDAAEKRRIEELTKQVREEQQVRELEEMQVCRSIAPRLPGTGDSPVVGVLVWVGGGFCLLGAEHNFYSTM